MGTEPGDDVIRSGIGDVVTGAPDEDVYGQVLAEGIQQIDRWGRETLR